MADEPQSPVPDEEKTTDAAPAEGQTPSAEAPAPPSEAAQDSVSFSRCASCAHSEKVDRAAGTFACTKHNMVCDAESDAIPDDCVAFVERTDKTSA